MYYSQNITISALQPQKPLSSRRHSSILSWNLRRINSELRFRFTRGDTDTPPSSILTGLLAGSPYRAQALAQPGQGIFPQPHPSLTQLSVLQPVPQPWPQTTLQLRLERTSELGYPGQNCSLQIPATSSGNLNSSPTFPVGLGARRTTKGRKILPTVVMKQVPNVQWALPVQGA